MSVIRPVLVTGAAGQLGTDVVAAFGARPLVAVDRAEIDITEESAVHEMVRSIRPSVIVNCAAYTAVDDCETNVDLAFAVNAKAPGYLAAAASGVGAHLVHLSTDYVFSGTKSEPYVETDTTGPRSVYGRSKLEGERAVGPDATIVRTSWLCGEHGPNMVKTVLRLAENRTDLRFVDDQRGHPSFAADLAPALVHVADERWPGVFHLTNQGAVSWYEFVREILEASGHDPDMVSPCATTDLDPPLPAPRPANSVLDNAAWRAAGERPTRHFREPLHELIAVLTAG